MSLIVALRKTLKPSGLSVPLLESIALLHPESRVITGTRDAKEKVKFEENPAARRFDRADFDSGGTYTDQNHQTCKDL
jgi:hypothetical protein